ncbi:hypothetical protein ACP275_04G154500 [Erythranthe tilingii]
MRRQNLLLLWMFLVILPCPAVEVVEEDGDTEIGAQTALEMERSSHSHDSNQRVWEEDQLGKKTKIEDISKIEVRQE